MPENQRDVLPFVTKDMLDFRHGMRTQIIIQSQSDEASAIQVIGATKAGTFTFQHTPNNDGSIKTEYFNIPDTPIWVSCIDGNGSFIAGQCHVTLSLRIAETAVLQLASGYIYLQKGVSWPVGNHQPSLPERGKFVQQWIETPNFPEHSITVPAYRYWKLNSIHWGLIADANTANRYLRIRASASTGEVIWEQDCDAVITANQDAPYTVAKFGGAAPASTATVKMANMADYGLLLPTNILSLRWVANQAGDAGYDLILSYEQFIGSPIPVTT